MAKKIPLKRRTKAPILDKQEDQPKLKLKRRKKAPIPAQKNEQEIKTVIVSLVNQKGGVGKTTIAINLSFCLSEMGHRVLLVDGDPQGSCLQWKSVSNNKAFNVIHHPEADIHKRIKELSKGYRYTVIDAPPGTGDVTLSILLASNLAIIPITPSPLDIWSSEEVDELIREARKHNRKLRGKLLISKKIVGTTPGREARDALKRYKLGIFETEINQRIVYVKSLIAGQSVIEYFPNSEASNEIRHLCKEIV